MFLATHVINGVSLLLDALKIGNLGIQIHHICINYLRGRGRGRGRGGECGKARGQLMGVIFLLYHVNPRDRTQVIKFDSRCSYPWSHLSPLYVKANVVKVSIVTALIDCVDSLGIAFQSWSHESG